MFESCVASEPSPFKDKCLGICCQGKEVNPSCGQWLQCKAWGLPHRWLRGVLLSLGRKQSFPFWGLYRMYFSSLWTSPLEPSEEG